MTEPEENKQHYDPMQANDVDELGAAIEIAADLDRLRGIKQLTITFPEQKKPLGEPGIRTLSTLTQNLI